MTAGTQSPANDPGAALIRRGRMPLADALTLDGRVCWTWPTICKAFRCDPNELAALLPEKHNETGKPLIGGHPLSY